LNGICRAELGIEPPTILTDRVLRATGEPTVEALLHHATAREVSNRRDPAGLAWILLDAAEDGDRMACDIVTQQGTELGRTAVAAARRVGIGPGDTFALALTGGVMRHSAGALRQALVGTVTAANPAVRVVPPALEPVAGALLLAFDAARIPVDDAVRARIAAGLADRDLYDTHPNRTSA
jgi:N-acetylglucosamine kinase-like BadF-type ATPase